MPNRSQRYLLRAIAIALLATPLPVVAAPAPMTLGTIVRTILPGCDNPTPVRAPSGAIYSNVSDCTVTGSPGKVSTGWVKVDPAIGWVPSNLTTFGNGRSGPKLSGAVVDGGTLYLLERNRTISGGMRVGRSASVAQPSVTWIANLNFGWGSFAQGSPGGYQYIYPSGHLDRLRYGRPRRPPPRPEG